jgi:hypothetical protein
MQKHLYNLLARYGKTLPHIYINRCHISNRRHPKITAAGASCVNYKIMSNAVNLGLPLSRSPVDVLYSTIVSLLHILLHIRERQTLCVILIIGPHRNRRPVRSRHHVT